MSLVNNRTEGNAPLTIQAIMDRLSHGAAADSVLREHGVLTMSAEEDKIGVIRAYLLKSFAVLPSARRRTNACGPHVARLTRGRRD